MAQWAKHLLPKCADLNLEPHPLRSGVLVAPMVSPMGRWEVETSETPRLASLAYFG